VKTIPIRVEGRAETPPPAALKDAAE